MPLRTLIVERKLPLAGCLAVLIPLLSCAQISADSSRIERTSNAGELILAPTGVGTVREERDELFMLAAMSYVYRGLNDPKGYDIAAVIAWNVDDEVDTPKFVIDRNQNFEKQGDIHHAEINTLRAAYAFVNDQHPALPPNATRDERYNAYKNDLVRATLYTTLEPCPMCATTITMSKTPLAIYCMEDPGLRAMKTHSTVIAVPTSFYGRTLSERRSALPLCMAANEAMWKVAEASQPAPGDPDAAKKRFSITNYLTANGELIFKPAHQALACFNVSHPENLELATALRDATGAAVCSTR